MNYNVMATYVAMGMDESEIRIRKLDRILPVRKYKKGTRPGVTGKDPLSKNNNEEIQWSFPDRDPTEEETGHS